MDKLKALREQRNTLLEKMDKLLDTVEAETRALSEEEQRAFDETTAEITKLDSTIKAIEKREALEQTETGSVNDDLSIALLTIVYEAFYNRNYQTEAGSSNGVNPLVKQIIEQHRRNFL